MDILLFFLREGVEGIKDVLVLIFVNWLIVN